MLDDEAVIWHISIERADHVVAVLMSVMQRVIEFMAECFCVANQIEPVPRPAFAEMWRVE